MSWISDFGGFTNKKEMQVKAANEIIPNKYIDQILRSMFWKNNLRLNDDTTSFIKDGYAGNVDIYSVINYVITTASNVRFKVQIKDGDVWEDDSGSDLIKLLNKPNPLTNYSLFIEEALGWKLLDGNMFIFGDVIPIGKNMGKPNSLWVMPSTKMQIVGGDIRKPIEGFQYNEWDELIPIEEVMYLRYFNPVGALDNLSGGLTGMSPLRAAVMAATKSNNAALAAVSAFENNGAIGIISKTGGEYADFTPEVAGQLKERWKEVQGGANNYGTMAFTSGQIDFNRLNMSPADLRLGESELQSKRQIAAMYKVPTQLLNDAEGATFSNQAAAQKSVYTNTILPEMRSLGEGLVNWLGEAYYGNQEIQIIPDTSNIEVLQEDKQAQATWLVNADWMTQNEKRSEMNLGSDPDPKMDDYLIPSTKVFKNDLDLFADVSKFTDNNKE